MDKKLWETGVAKRKAVLGDAYVDKAMSNATEFNGPFQDMLNEFCWGKVWGDDRLAMKTHSLLNVGMLAALGRMEEWELHFRGAITNGCTRDELQAVLHQIAIYCGFPAGVACFKIANRVFAEIDAKK
jgi:4-carboxymuconolactone decarboxylase